MSRVYTKDELLKMQALINGNVTAIEAYELENPDAEPPTSRFVGSSVSYFTGDSVEIPT